MAKKKTTPLEQAAAEVVQMQDTIAQYEAHEAECARQLEEANRIAEEWSRALLDTQALLQAQREKLDRECARLHIEANALERKFGRMVNRLPRTVMRNETPFD